MPEQNATFLIKGTHEECMVVDLSKNKTTSSKYIKTRQVDYTRPDLLGRTVAAWRFLTHGSCLMAKRGGGMGSGSGWGSGGGGGRPGALSWL